MILINSIGFTGTQQGMSQKQKELVSLALDCYEPQRVSHGDCIGSDSEFHEIAMIKGIPVALHPPIKSDKRAFCKGWSECAPKKEYLARNRDIVDSCDLLIATPKELYGKEAIRSGTWSTIRYAKKNHKRYIIIYPNGKVIMY